jgi:hypothetical protein
VTGLQTALNAKSDATVTTTIGNKITALVDATSGVSSGDTAPATGPGHRIAIYESTSSFYGFGSYFYGLGLVDNSVAGLGLWGGTGNALPEQGTGSGVLPHMLVTTAGRVGIGDQNPAQALCVTGNCVVSGSITGATKSFDVEHEGRDGYRLRHWCVEGDAPGGSLMYKRQITAPKAGVADLIMPSWFAWLAKNVMVFCNGFKHHGTSWGEQDELDPCVIHLNVSKGGIYNVLVTADRADMCATTMCPQETEYVPALEPSGGSGFPQ